jgi:hypothetical protein
LAEIFPDSGTLSRTVFQEPVLQSWEIVLPHEILGDRSKVRFDLTGDWYRGEGVRNKTLNAVLADGCNEAIPFGITLQNVDGLLRIELTGSDQRRPRPTAQFETSNRISECDGAINFDWCTHDSLLGGFDPPC